jgi:DNA-binding NarL/FixJ family response regulator
MTETRCLVADGHPVMLRAVSDVLGAAGYDVVGKTSERSEVLDLIRRLEPAIAILDAAMLGMTGEELWEACTATRVVIFTGNDGESVTRAGIEPGALAYVSKSQPLVQLVDVVGIVASGGTWVDPAVAPVLVVRGARVAEALTAREREVLELVADGRSYGEIARLLSITVSTVQQHVSAAVEGLSADTRTQAVATALRLFLID